VEKVSKNLRLQPKDDFIWLKPKSSCSTSIHELKLVAIEKPNVNAA
jgi:hypothetical protein